MNSHRFGSPPAEICEDLRKSQRQNLLVALRFRKGRGGRCRVAAGRAMVAGGRRDNGQEAAIVGWSWRSAVLVAAGMARRPRPRPASLGAHSAQRPPPCWVRSLSMGGAWRAVRVWLRDASLVVGARVLCSTSWAICTDPIDLSRGRLARDGRASTMRLGSVAAARGSWACDMHRKKSWPRWGLHHP